MMGHITRGMLTWPPEKAGTGPALSGAEAAETLGISVTALNSRISRRAEAPIPFPIEDGWAFRPIDGDPSRTHRLQPVPYWFKRTILAYGKRVHDLDQDGAPIAPRRHQVPVE